MKGERGFADDLPQMPEVGARLTAASGYSGGRRAGSRGHGSDSKESACNVGDGRPGFDPWVGNEYWSGLLCPPLRDLPDPRIEPASLKSLALVSRFFAT